MHKYEIKFKYNTDSNGGCTSKTALINLPKRYFAFSDAYGSDGKGNNEILLKAVNELGLDPSNVDAIYDKTKLDGGWYNLKYIGKEDNTKNQKAVKEVKPKKSFWTPAWAIPFKIIWFLIRRILFFWI